MNKYKKNEQRKRWPIGNWSFRGKNLFMAFKERRYRGIEYSV